MWETWSKLYVIQKWPANKLMEYFFPFLCCPLSSSIIQKKILLKQRIWSFDLCSWNPRHYKYGSPAKLIRDTLVQSPGNCWARPPSLLRGLSQDTHNCLWIVSTVTEGDRWGNQELKFQDQTSMWPGAWLIPARGMQTRIQGRELGGGAGVWDTSAHARPRSSPYLSW